MSFQSNEQILRIPPSLFFVPTLSNYVALISAPLQGEVTVSLPLRSLHLFDASSGAALSHGLEPALRGAA